MKTLRRSAALILALCIVLPFAASAANKPYFARELDAAIYFSNELEKGNITLDLSVPQNFDYSLCYQYISMLYRDSYVFEYVPSQVNAYIKIVYNDAYKHDLAEAEAARLASTLITTGMSQREKYYAIYSYLRDRCEYDMHAALNQSNEISDSFSAYGALINGKAVCDGLSAAFAMICRHAGLPCIYVAAPEMNHSWNAVLYKGNVAYLDLTYDITGKTQDKYFLMTETELAADHSWNTTRVRSLTDVIWDGRFISAYTLNQLGGLFRGSDKGWELDRRPTRAEAAIMLVRFLGLEQRALSEGYDPATFPFTDVNPNHAPYIAMLYRLGLTNGTSPTTFTPNVEVSYRDYTTFMLRALDYSDILGDFSWANAPTDAVRLGIVSSQQHEYLSRVSFDRGMMAYESLVALIARNSAGKPLYQKLIETGALSEKVVRENLF